MSIAVGLASASAVLLRLLETSWPSFAPWLPSAPGITAGPPDLVGKDSSTLNLFLYRVTRNTGWPDVPSRPPLSVAPPGQTGSLFGPLVVDLHYAVTAHSKDPLVAELLLGEAMLTLHEHQHVGRNAIAAILSDTTHVSPPYDKSAVQALEEATALARQMESLTISSQPAGLEQLSQFWSAAQTPARSCAFYLVTAVVLERLDPRPIPRIVLSRGPLGPTGQEPGPAVKLIGDSTAPRLVSVEMDAGDPSALLGESVVLRGVGLVGTASAELRRGDDAAHTVAFTRAEGDEAAFAIDGMTGDWHPGVYSIRGWNAGIASNALPLQLAPRVDWAGAVVGAVQGPVGDVPATRELEVSFEPPAAEDQEILLFVGGAGYRADANPTQIAKTATRPPRTRATFHISALPTGEYPARLSVDGIDSHQFDRSTRPPSLRIDQKVTVT